MTPEERGRQVVRVFVEKRHIILTDHEQAYLAGAVSMAIELAIAEDRRTRRKIPARRKKK